MELDKEYLLNLKNQAIAERQRYMDMVQQANGAIAMVDVLLTELDRKEPESQDGESTI